MIIILSFKGKVFSVDFFYASCTCWEDQWFPPLSRCRLATLFLSLSFPCQPANVLRSVWHARSRVLFALAVWPRHVLVKRHTTGRENNKNRCTNNHSRKNGTKSRSVCYKPRNTVHVRLLSCRFYDINERLRLRAGSLLAHARSVCIEWQRLK